MGLEMLRAVSLLAGIAVLSFFDGCVASREDVSGRDYDPFPYAIGEGDRLQSVYNSDSTYVLKYVLPNKSPGRHVRFALFNVMDGAIVFADELEDASVSWRSQHEVEVELRPGIVPADDFKTGFIHGYVYDLRLKKKLRRDESVVRPDSE